MPVPNPPVIAETQPAPPRRYVDDRETYSLRMDDWLSWFTTKAWVWLYDLVPWIQARANETEAWANQASAAATTASSAAGAVPWVSGVTYGFGVSVIDPTDVLTYRRKVAGAGTTRPGLDATNWLQMGTAKVDAANTFSAVQTFTGGIAGVQFGMRNRIINGDMRIDQRNAGASVTPANGGFSVDRWKLSVSQTSKLTAQQNAGSVTPPAGFVNYLGITSTSAYSITSTDLFTLVQPIEGFNSADLAWGSASAQSVTLSFLVRSSLTGTFGGALGNNVGNRSYPFTFSISAANTWEFKAVTIAGDTTGTWTTGNSAGINLRFGLGVGSTYSGTAGSWAGSNFLSATGATSVVGTNGATFYITGVQLEAGSVSTPFERKDYGFELLLCQRYWRTQSESFIGAWQAGSGLFLCNSLLFSQPMRAAPTVGQPGGFIIQGVTASATGFAVSASSTGFSLVGTSSNGQPDGTARIVNGNSPATFNAEL